MTVLAEAGDHAEVVDVAGGDNQVVEGERPPGGLHDPGRRIDASGLGVNEVDAVGFEGLGDGKGHILDRALAKGDPYEGRVEEELV
jgi:hypothetical protein